MKKLMLTALLGASAGTALGAAGSPKIITVTNNTGTKVGIITNLWRQEPSYLILAQGQSGTIAAPNYQPSGKAAPMVAQIFNRPLLVFLSEEPALKQFTSLKTMPSEQANKIVFGQEKSALNPYEIGTVSAEGISYLPQAGHKITINKDQSVQVQGTKGTYEFKLAPLEKASHMTHNLAKL